MISGRTAASVPLGVGLPSFWIFITGVCRLLTDCKTWTFWSREAAEWLEADSRSPFHAGACQNSPRAMVGGFLNGCEPFYPLSLLEEVLHICMSPSLSVQGRGGTSCVLIFRFPYVLPVRRKAERRTGQCPRPSMPPHQSCDISAAPPKVTPLGNLCHPCFAELLVAWKPPPGLCPEFLLRDRPKWD